jgi:glycosyltransferase involved in cell wall biosynthesis
MAKRVTFVLPDFGAGGAQRVMVSVANGLDRERYAASFLVLNHGGPWRDLVANDIPVTSLGRTRLRQTLGSLRTALRSAAPDVIVSTIGYVNLGVLACRPSRIPVIVRESNTPHSGSKNALSRMVQHLAYAALYRRADCVVSPSSLIGGELENDFHVPPRLIHVLRNPVDEAALRALASPPRRRPGGGARFVAVGRLSRQKGYDLLLDTVKALPNESHVTILGEGEERALLEAQLRTLGLGKCVTLAGFEPNPAPWMAGADALLLTSRWEGLPNVALESLACGTPVIAAPNAGAIAEIADRAQPGAVTVATMGPDFLSAMAAAPRNESARLRGSLLPKEFQQATVIEEYQRQIDSVYEGRRTP